jgi:hypothetical protein
MIWRMHLYIISLKNGWLRSPGFEAVSRAKSCFAQKKVSNIKLVSMISNVKWQSYKFCYSSKYNQIASQNQYNRNCFIINKSRVSTEECEIDKNK